MSGFGKIIKKQTLELRKVFTGEDVTFHTLTVKTNANLDINGDPIDSEEAVVTTDNTVVAKYVRVLHGRQAIEKTVGGEFQDADAVLDMDDSYADTVNNTKLDKGYVTVSGINYTITHIRPLTCGGTVSRLLVGLSRKD